MPTHATLPLWDDANDGEKLAKLRVWVEDLYRYQLGGALEHIRATLRAHQPADPKETRDRDLILDWCDRHPDIMNMHCEPGHLTGSALIVHPASGRVLLNHHRTLNLWMQFGGHFDYEVEPWRVALREAREESGIHDLAFLPNMPDPAPFDVDVHSIPARGNRPTHLHLDLRYLLSTNSPEQALISGESHEIRWLTFAEAEALVHSDELLRMLGKARRALAAQV